MTSFITLSIIIILCLILGDIFKPTYGRCRGCSGCALDAHPEMDKKMCKLEKRRLDYLKEQKNIKH
jgi:hypothetical protein